MGPFSLWHWLLVVAIILIVICGGLPRVMEDFTRGIRAFGGLLPVRGAIRTKAGTLEAVVRQGSAGAGERKPRQRLLLLAMLLFFGIVGLSLWLDGQ